MCIMQALESSNEKKHTSPVSHFSHVHPRFLDSQPRHPSYVEAHHSHRSCRPLLFWPQIFLRHVMLLLSTNQRLGRFNPVEKVLVHIGSSPTKVGLPINNFESTTKLMSRPRFTIHGCQIATIWCSPGKHRSKLAIHSKGQRCVHEKAMYHVVLVGG